MSKITHRAVRVDHLEIMLGDLTPFGTVAGFTTDFGTEELLVIFSAPNAVISLLDLFPFDHKMTVLRPV